MPRLTRLTFQHGSLTIEPRSTGHSVWIFRWREFGPDGKRIQRKTIVGTTKEYPTKAKAERAAAPLRLDITKEQPERVREIVTVSQLVSHYKEKELGEDGSKSFKTRQVYEGHLDKYIQPRWGNYRWGEVRTVAVEDWLGSLNLANPTKAKMRNVFHALYSHAQRYQWHEANPITKVRQSAQRQKEPDILDAAELTCLLTEVPEPFRSMVFVAAATGLRRGEMIGLKWQDVDFEGGLIYPRRSVVSQNIGKLKTVASGKPVALDPDLAVALENLKAGSPFNQAEDWVFASPASGGKKPYWPDMVLNRRVRPAATRLGITKTIGWHTFRHTYATLLKSSGADVKVVQDSLRHANARITMELYTQALTQDKRTAQTKVVQMILPKSAPPVAAAG